MFDGKVRGQGVSERLHAKTFGRMMTGRIKMYAAFSSHVHGGFGYLAGIR